MFRPTSARLVLFAVVPSVVLTTLLIALSPALAVTLLILGFAAAVIALRWQAGASILGAAYALSIVLFVCASLLPFDRLLLPTTALMVLTVTLRLVTCPPGRSGKLVLVVSAIVLYWILHIGLSTQPSLDVSALGLRKSLFILLGLLAGLAAERRSAGWLKHSLIWLLAIALLISVAGHIWFPQIEGMVSRDADVYTSMIGGEQRMQGLFAGPFHVSIAGGAVSLYGMRLARRRILVGSALCIIGLVAIYLSMVRTGYLAFAVAGAFGYILRSRVSKGSLRLVVLAPLAGIVVFFALRRTPVLDRAVSMISSIADFGNDSRLTNRLVDYVQAGRMIGDRPLLGWGPGVAGDTMGSHFPAGGHVTAHNLGLKLMVEGGGVGLALWLVALALCFSLLDKYRSDGMLSVEFIILVLVFGITGSAIEALPVTFILAAWIGASISHPDAAAPTGPILIDRVDFRHQSAAMTAFSSIERD